MKNDRIPTWGILLMLAGSIVGSILLGMQLMQRYKKHWPW